MRKDILYAIVLLEVILLALTLYQNRTRLSSWLAKPVKIEQKYEGISKDWCIIIIDSCDDIINHLISAGWKYDKDIGYE